MQILLLKDVKRVGQRMDVKEVSNGYARNFLIPQKLAVAADKNALNLKIRWENEQRILTDQLRNLAQKLSDLALDFKVRTGLKDEVFGSVNKEDIKDALARHGITNGEPRIQKPLKNLGEHQVEIDLGQGIRASVKVILRAEP